MVVPKLSRPCIIGIDLLDEFRSHIDLDSKTISFPHLEGKPSIRIVNEEIPASPAEKTHALNWITEIKDDIEIKKEKIRLKIEETNTANAETKKGLEDILWRHRAIFRKKPGRLKIYQHVLRVKENQPFIGRSYPIPVAYREKVDEKIRKMLNMGIIQRSSSPYINPIVPVIKKDGAVPLQAESKKCPAFQHRGKSYEFNVVPFGLKTSTAALLRGLDHVLQGIGDHII